MSTILLIAGLSAALSSFFALVRVRHPAIFSFPVMLLGWPASELAIFHLIAQVAATVGLTALGALDSTSGAVGAAAMAISWVLLVRVQQVASGVRGALADTLAATHPDAAEQVRAADAPGWLRRPFRNDATGLEHTPDLAYGDATDQRVDIYRPVEGGSGRPVLVFIHGGAWISGNKDHYGLPLVYGAARAGWVVVTIDYRLGPKNRFPEQRADVDAAISWVRANIAEHGGDPSFVAVSGASAGGQLASLAALTPASGPIQACVPIYGAYDFTDHHGIRGYARMEKFLERMVMPTKLRDDADGWKAASPIHVISPEAPPFLIVQGRNDVLIWREEAEAFAEALAEAATQPVVYAEVEGGQHNFELFHSVRSEATIDAIVAFLASTHRRAKAAAE